MTEFIISRVTELHDGFESRVVGTLCAGDSFTAERLAPTKFRNRVNEYFAATAYYTKADLRFARDMERQQDAKDREWACFLRETEIV